MEIKMKLLLNLLLVATAHAQGASILERSVAYVKGVASAYGPGLLALASCATQHEAWSCAREKAGKMLDLWDSAVDQQRRSWGEAADREAAAAAAAAAEGGSGRAAAAAEPPSAVGGELEASLQSLTDLVQNTLARAMARKKGGGGIDSITLSTSSGEKKKKMKKKKKRPQKIQIIQGHPQMLMMMKKHEKGRQLEDTRRIPIQAWVIGHPESEHEKETVKPPQKSEHHARVAREVTDAWTPISAPVSEAPKSNPQIARDDDEVPKAVEVVSGRGALEDAWDNVKQMSELLAEDDEDETSAGNDELREGEQRGKKKKKKKAILKLLLLGAVAKAKIGLLLQLLSAKLQIKFFLIALAGLIINVARFWLDLKKGGQPQKVIYYEHAQHQHHYEHEDEGWGGGGGGYWSRSIDEPKEEDNIYPATETEHDDATHTHAHIPYRAYRPANGAAGRAAGRAAH